jgi:hypothetical protein
VFTLDGSSINELKEEHWTSLSFSKFQDELLGVNVLYRLVPVGSFLTFWLCEAWDEEAQALPQSVSKSSL